MRCCDDIFLHHQQNKTTWALHLTLIWESFYHDPSNSALSSTPLQVLSSPCWWRAQRWGLSPASTWLFLKRWREWVDATMMWWQKRSRLQRPWMRRRLGGCGRSAASWWVWRRRGSLTSQTPQQRSRAALHRQSQHRHRHRDRAEEQLSVLWDCKSAPASWACRGSWTLMSWAVPASVEQLTVWVCDCVVFMMAAFSTRLQVPASGWGKVKSRLKMCCQNFSV